MKGRGGEEEEAGRGEKMEGGGRKEGGRKKKMEGRGRKKETVGGTVMGCWRPTMELLSPMAVMSEGLCFNLCAAPFLNVCVPNLPQGARSGECWGWSELGQRCRTRCHTRVGWRETKLDCSEDEG